MTLLKFDRIKRIGRILLFVFLIGLLAGVLIWVEPTSPLIEMERTVVFVKTENNAAYIRFAEEETTFVFYEFENTELSCLAELREGDLVVVTVESDYLEFENALLQRLTVGDRVLFDSIAFYRDGNVTAKDSICWALLVGLAAALVLELKGKTEKQTEHYEFEIRNSRAALTVGWSLSLGGSAGALVFPVRWLLGCLNAGRMLYGLIFLFFALIGYLLVYIYHRECFAFQNGVFFYRKVFAKTETARISDVREVCYLRSGLFVKVIFYGKNGETLISFFDDGTAFKNGAFERALKAYRIPISQVYDAKPRPAPKTHLNVTEHDGIIRLKKKIDPATAIGWGIVALCSALLPIFFTDFFAHSAFTVLYFAILCANFVRFLQLFFSTVWIDPMGKRFFVGVYHRRSHSFSELARVEVEVEESSEGDDSIYVSMELKSGRILHVQAFSKAQAEELARILRQEAAVCSEE